MLTVISIMLNAVCISLSVFLATSLIKRSKKLKDMTKYNKYLLETLEKLRKNRKAADEKIDEINGMHDVNSVLDSMRKFKEAGK